MHNFIRYVMTRNSLLAETALQKELCIIEIPDMLEDSVRWKVVNFTFTAFKDASSER